MVFVNFGPAILADRIAQFGIHKNAIGKLRAPENSHLTFPSPLIQASCTPFHL